MASVFYAEVADPAQAFAQIQSWARSGGYQLVGDAAAGQFRGTPRGLAGAFIGEIVGSYTVEGSRVTIQVNKNLPASEVARALAPFGMRLIGSR